MQQYKIALDIDDVLAAFYPAFCQRMGKPSLRLNIWDGEEDCAFIKNNVHIVENNFRFWQNLNTLSNPGDINFDFECYITSSPKRMKDYRAQWLYEKGFPVKPVISTSNKVQEMTGRGINVLVDDNPYSLNSVREAGFIPIQFVPPYMSEENPELNIIRHLSQVPEVLKNL